MTLAKLDFNIDKVKVYATGARITRIAKLELVEREIPNRVEIAGLPLALEDSSIGARVEAEDSQPTTSPFIGKIGRYLCRGRIYTRN